MALKSGVLWRQTVMHYVPKTPGNSSHYFKNGSYGEQCEYSLESCDSSVVEHSLGKGEAESSILSRSTSKIKDVWE
jgi:hypothetical protein